MQEANKGGFDKLVERSGVKGDPLGGVFVGDDGGEDFLLPFSKGKFKFVGLLLAYCGDLFVSIFAFMGKTSGSTI